MTAHLGPRVSALLDGQLSEQETERAWSHVHLCHLCRDHVEREGWIKTRLARTSFEPGPAAPAALKGALLGMPPGDFLLALSHDHGPRPRGRRAIGFAAIGGGAVGAAVMGVLALGTAPADVSHLDRRAPVAQVTTPTPAPVKLPARSGR